jgi:hypothetical protein
MIPLIVCALAAQSVATQFHTAVRLGGQDRSYLFVQTMDSANRLVLLIALGYAFSALGIISALILSSMIKIAACRVLLK